MRPREGRIVVGRYTSSTGRAVWDAFCRIKGGHTSGTLGWASKARDTQPEAYAAALRHLYEAHGIGTGA